MPFDNGFSFKDKKNTVDHRACEDFSTKFGAHRAQSRGSIPAFSKVEVVDRRHIVPQASGDVLEIGIGDGQNLSHYKRLQVSSLIGVDPEADIRWLKRQSKRYDLPLQVIPKVFEFNDFRDEQFDCIVSTHTLSAVQDPLIVLSELRRILKPGGRLLFSERGRLPSAFAARLQDYISPLWQNMARGCRVNLNMFRLIERAGFHVDFLETGAEPFRPRLIGYLYTGIALKV